MLDARVDAAYGRRTMRWVGILLLAAGCSSRAGAAANEAMDGIVPRPGRLHALLLNGGGRPEINYQSHLQHVKAMMELLEADGVPREDITVFSGDGSDAALDLATRERPEEAESWLIPHNVALRPPIVYVNSAIDGMPLHPARKDALCAWFQQQGSLLGRGDTLLFYVTDHGRRNEQDLGNNKIVLWGEELSVAELSDLFALLDPDVRVVMLMSQCYAGSFANEIFRNPGQTMPSGNVCGYFASPADRPAYGCYAENRGRDGVGHSFNFVQALALLGRLSEANRRVLVTDNTPDAPHTSSDFFLDRLLNTKAGEAGKVPNRYIDDQLAEAWKHRSAWEPEIRLLDRIGQAFGSFSARSLAELDEQSRALPELSRQLDLYAQRWKQALESLKVESLKAFVDAHPAWRPRLDPSAVAKLDAEARRATTAELLGALAPFTRADADRARRLLLLRQKAEDAAAASYRLEVRLGTVLRMRSLLTSVAGRQYISTRATAAERQAYERLQSCEDLRIGDTPAVAAAAELDAPKPFPPLADERRTVEAVMPAWMGINYAPLTEAQQKKHDTRAGAVMTRTVLPDSPAIAAGLRAGDIILGPPDNPFAEPNQIREWTMRSEIGTPQRLAILRGDKPMLISLRPGPYPLEVPRLPGPPKVGSTAPPVVVDLLKGPERLADGKSRLLFFWATWCTVCKSALPEVLAFGRDRDVEIVAVSDEEPDVVRDFLGSYPEPFPSIVAADRNRLTFENYGVSGLPTLVWVDGDGVVRYVKTGYAQPGGLGIEGWKWSRPAAPRATPQRLP